MVTRLCAWAACCGFLFAVASLARGDVPQPTDYFTIRVVDDATGRGVPLVELKTTAGVRYWTDSAGVVAFHEPGLMGSSVFFHVSSHGYEFPKDGFGFRGQALWVTPGGSATLKIRRLNIAERLYRVTGEGIYRDTVLVGGEPPIARPLLNARVTGSDSVVSAVYGGRVYWFWGDTSRPRYPLGNFHVPGATSALPVRGGLDPAVGVNLECFTGEDGFAKATCRMPGEGPTWIDGLVVLGERGAERDGVGSSDPDASSVRVTRGERMFAHYVKIRPPLEVYRRGLVEWDDAASEFRDVLVFPEGAAAYPGGHPLKHTVDGVEYVYFAKPYPLLRVRATPEALADLSQYEAFTYLEPGSTKDSPQVDRGEDARLRYGWKRNAAVVGPQEQQRLAREKLIEPGEGLLQLQDRDTGKAVLAHAGSVDWNAHRRRWVLITCEQFGTSFLGEVWYAEADTPIGPWAYAVKVVTHEKYSFYNPRRHPFFDADGGRRIYFEGTYTAMFSGNEHPTPRYEYNQIMYGLDLADPRLVLPVPVYQSGDVPAADALATRGHGAEDEPRGRIAFFAPDRPFAGSRPVRVVRDADGTAWLVMAAGADRPDRPDRADEAAALFHALPADAGEPPGTTRPLYEFRRRSDGRFAYSTDEVFGGADYDRGERPLCRVWGSPFAAWPPSAREPEARR